MEANVFRGTTAGTHNASTEPLLQTAAAKSPEHDQPDHIKAFRPATQW